MNLNPYMRVYMLSETKRNELREALRRAWPAPVVIRTEVPRFSGGLVASGTMANADSAGTGPERIRMGRRTAYMRDSLIEWLLDRCGEVRS